MLPKIFSFSSKSSALARDVHGVTYLPGFIGLNNLTHTDYINVTLHALSHVRPLREFFLDPIRYATSNSVLVHKFGEVMRKIWSKHNFKSVVSPQEFIQVCLSFILIHIILYLFFIDSNSRIKKEIYNWYTS